MQPHAPRASLLNDPIDPAERARIELTVSCRDTDVLPKVDGAGSVVDLDGQEVQIMHNGVRVVAGGYYGAWTAEIIERLHGHHEPQEEVAFHHVVERVRATADGAPVIVELGAFWSYYSLWFLTSCAGARAVLVEPDPSHLSVLHANLALNGASALVIEAAVGEAPEDPRFTCEDGNVVDVEWLTLGQILDRAGASRADVVLCDVQGAETAMLQQALPYLASRVRFLVLSTHHVSISGHWDTHEQCLALLRSTGAHVIAEHHIIESFSGDGLIVVSFDERDTDMSVHVSLARATEVLFPYSPAALEDAARHTHNLESALEESTRYVHSLQDHVATLEASVQESTRYVQSLLAHIAGLEAAVEESREDSRSLDTELGRRPPGS